MSLLILGSKIVYKMSKQSEKLSIAEYNSDHYLVKGKLKVKLKKLISRKRTLVNRYDVNKLKNTNVCGSFKQKLHEIMNQ